MFLHPTPHKANYVRGIPCRERSHLLTFPPMADRLLDTAEAARQLGIARSTLLDWVNNGKIAIAWRGKGLRGPYLFHPAEIARVKNQRSEGADS